MSIIRTLAATAASAAVAAALVVGLAAPAGANTLPLPNPVPVNHNPSLGGPIVTTPIRPVQPTPSIPLPPGYQLPFFTIPGCAGMVTAHTISLTASRFPGFGPVATPVGAVAAYAPQLVNVVRADGGVTCAFGVGGVATVLVTETKISPADYATIKAWYDSRATSSHAGGSGSYLAGTLDTHYSVGSFPDEYATISPNGWWITVKDVAHIGALPYFQQDTVANFFQLNPRLALITR